MRDRTSVSPFLVRVRTSSGKRVMFSFSGARDEAKNVPRIPWPGSPEDDSQRPPAGVILTEERFRGNPYPGPPRWGDTMSHSYESGRAMAELGSKQPHELLLMLGGLLAVLLTLAKYGIQWATPPGITSSQYATVATAVIINVVLGGALWVSSA